VFSVLATPIADERAPVYALVPIPAYQKGGTMADPIYMRIGEGTRIELPDLVGAMGSFLGLLRDVDSTISNRKSGILKWLVTDLNYHPSPLIGVTPFFPKKGFTRSDVLVEQEIITGVGTLTEKGERTKSLSDAALGKIEKIAKTAGKIGKTQIYTSQNGDFNLHTTVTVKTLTQVQELTRGQSLSFGIVVGELGSISVHNGMEFRVWDENTQRPVRCKFGSSLVKRVTDFLGSRVSVSGMMLCDRNGQPLAISVESVDGVAERPTRSLDELMGSVPDLTGGLSLREFLEDFD
jgi:hypothetical protein